MRRLSRSIWPIVVFLFLMGASFLRTANASDIVHATLKNGLRAVIVRNPLAPVVTTMVNYLVGSNEAPPGFPGMAHAQEHMMFRGSPGLSAAQLANIIAAMGGRFDADTQQTVTQYYFTVPVEDLDVALHIEAIRMRDVLNAQELWEKERGAIEQEVAQDLSNPMYVFYARLLSEIFAGTPYAHDALGTRPSFEKTTGAMLKDFYDSWYAPNNAILVIVGDVDPERTLETVKDLFGAIPSRPVPPHPEVHLHPHRPSTIKLETDLPYGISIVAYRLPGYDSPDYAAGLILADILDSERGNLYGLVPEGKALMAGFGSTILPKAGVGYAFAAFPHGGDGLAMIEAIKGVIADYLKKGLPEDLIDASKRHEVADAEFRKNSVEGLAGEWSQALAVEGNDSPDESIEAIKRVTVQDVNRSAREYLINDTAIVAVLTPRPSGKAVASEVLRGKESFAPKETKPIALPAWTEKAVLPPALPRSNLNPTVMVLPNGLRLIVQPEKISRSISLYGRVKNNPDLETPEGQEGVAEVLDGLFSYGTANLDRLAFQKAVDDIAADLSVGTSFSLLVLTEHVDRGVGLLADNLLHPALPETAFKVVKKETVSIVAGRMQSPSYLAKHAIRAALYPQGDPALRQPTPETVAGLSLDDVKQYYKKTFRPDLVTIVVIGDITPARARSIVEKYFGGWQASGTKPETELPPVPLNKASATAVPDTSRVQDQVVLAETLGLTRSNPDYYALQMGNHVLSGAFYATRLYHDLREEAGLVYTVESFLDARKTRSVYQVIYACDPPNVSQAKTMVEQNLRKMQTLPVTPLELRQAKALLLRQIPLSESSVDNIAESLLHLSLEGLPLDEPVKDAQHYLTITDSDVQAAFAKWIRPEDLAQVSLGPKPE
jgi:zinc protease